jgi:hypothetical protein
VVDPSEGAHIAVLYRNTGERDAGLTGYLSAAAARGEDAVGITDAVLDVPGAGDAVEMLRVADTYLAEGDFDADAMAGWLAGLAAQAPRGSAERRTRIAGDLAWTAGLDDDGFAELLRYEATLDGIAPTSRHTYACFYSLADLSVRHLIEVLRTHPQVLIDGALWESPFYPAQA